MSGAGRTTKRGGEVGDQTPDRLHECIPGKDRIVTYEAVAAYSLLTVRCHLQKFSEYKLSKEEWIYATNAACSHCFLFAGTFSSCRRVGSVCSSCSTLRMLSIFQVQEWVLCGRRMGGVLNI